MNYFLFKSYLKYWFRSRYRKGYGLHSPFVFNLVRELIYCKLPFYAFPRMDALRKKLKISQATIQMCDYGAGSTAFSSQIRKVSDLEKKSSVNKKYGEILFRLVNEFKPQNIIELGTSLGISTCYLAMPDSNCKVYSIEGCENTANIARKNLQEMKCNGVELINGQFQDVLPDLVASLDQLDFVFFDGHHEKIATIDYFNQCLLKKWNNTVFVFDDIHWSKGMDEAWEIIYSHPSVTVSIDLFQIGIIFFRKECKKQHFVVKY
nr:class I SAM-dependent methyltransferase [uncultured Carboxylicivirga sp.]